MIFILLTHFILHYLKENDFKSFAFYCNAINEKQDDKEKQKLYELVNYFQNNWDSIVQRINGTHCGSFTEPLISHTLSQRLSRNPLAWSKEGLAKMSMLRVFQENGGLVTSQHIRISRIKKDRSIDFNRRKNGLDLYNSYAQKQIDSVLSNYHDWSIFDPHSILPGFSYGKLSGTTVLLKSFARLKAV